MIRFVVASFALCLLVCTNAHAGIGGTWLMEFLLCMETAESAGIPRDDARSQCGQGLVEQDEQALELDSLACATDAKCLNPSEEAPAPRR